MPSKTPILRQEAARRLIGDRSFSAGGDRGPVGSPLGAHAGVEVEWLTVSTHNAESHIPLRDTRGAVAAAGTLPGGCRITFEPGGQLELSSPADLPSAACQAVAEDVAHLRRHLSDYGITLAGMGRDPLRPERRVLQFTIVRLEALRPMRLTPAEVSAALTNTRFANDELLIQRPSRGA